MRILVTNDDGVDAVGLHVLAAGLVDLGDVVVAAPDREYSGAGAALGTLHLIRPEVRRVEIEGVPEAWSVTGPPGAVRDVRPARRVRRTVRPRRVGDQPGGQLGPCDLPLGHRRRGAHRPQRRRVGRRREPGRRRLRRRGPGLGRDARRPAVGHRRRGWREGGCARCSTDRQPIRSCSTSTCRTGARSSSPDGDGRRGAPAAADAAPAPSSSRRSVTTTPSTCGWTGVIRSSCRVDTDSGAVEAGYIAITALTRLADDMSVDLDAVTTALDVR